MKRLYRPIFKKNFHFFDYKNVFISSEYNRMDKHILNKFGFMCNLAEDFNVELRRQSDSPKFTTYFLLCTTKV